MWEAIVKIHRAFEILERIGIVAYRLALPPRTPRGVSRLHALKVYSRSSSCGGLGTDRG